jgi:hypothetical protein
MTIFNYKIVSYKKFMAFAVVFSILVGSASLLFQKAHVVDAAITDCTTIIGNLITNCSFENPTGVLPLPAQANTPTSRRILDTGLMRGFTRTGLHIDDGGKQGNVGTIFNIRCIFYCLHFKAFVLSMFLGIHRAADYIEKAGMGIQSDYFQALTVGEDL